MRRRGTLARRSAVDWGVRGGIALVALVLCYLSLNATLAEVVKRSDLARAHRLAPGNGRISALLAEKQWSANPAPAAQVPIAGLAQRALRDDPTAISAVATLGFQAQVRGNEGAAHRWFAYAQMLSRRHLATQLWAVEDAVTRGDVPGALHHYDIALRASKAAPDLMYPVLAGAIADPTIRRNLVATMARRPPWAADFVDHVAIHPVDLRATADLFAALRHAKVPVSAGATALIVTRLVESGAVADAWRYYASVRAGADRRRSRDPGFDANPGTPSSFDWMPVDDVAIAATIQRNDHGGVFDFSVPTGGGGAMLRQMQVLPAGAYRLAGHSMNIDLPDQARPYWMLSCSDGRELGRVDVPNSAQANGLFSGRFDVPQDCPVQTLSLVARPSDAMGGVAGQIDRVEMAPLSDRHGND